MRAGFCAKFSTNKASRHKRIATPTRFTFPRYARWNSKYFSLSRVINVETRRDATTLSLYIYIYIHVYIMSICKRARRRHIGLFHIDCVGIYGYVDMRVYVCDLHCLHYLDLIRLYLETKCCTLYCKFSCSVFLRIYIHLVFSRFWYIYLSLSLFIVGHSDEVFLMRFVLFFWFLYAFVYLYSRRFACAHVRNTWRK